MYSFACQCYLLACLGKKKKRSLISIGKWERLIHIGYRGSLSYVTAGGNNRLPKLSKSYAGDKKNLVLSLQMTSFFGLAIANNARVMHQHLCAFFFFFFLIFRRED